MGLDAPKAGVVGVLAPPKLKPVPCITTKVIQQDGMHHACHMYMSARLATDRRRGGSTKVKCHFGAVHGSASMAAELGGRHVCSAMTRRFYTLLPGLDAS